jgi:dTDP-4-amino-4,6-dideoxygalactose transaminase
LTQRGKREAQKAAPEAIAVMVPRLPETAALLPYLNEIDANRWYSNFGPLQRRLEARLAEHLRLSPNGVVCVGNCTAGLMLALMAAAPHRGGYCVMPSFSFAASAHAVLAAGFTPYFIDVDPVSWTVTPAAVAEAARSANGAARVALVVSPFGAPVDIAAWDKFAAASGIPVVVDAAAGFDGAAGGKSAVVVSLHATKALAAGEGGFVVSRDEALIGAIGARSNFGFRGDRRASAAGFNGKMSEYNAAVGLASLDAWPAKREALLCLTRLYRDAFADVGNVGLSPGFGDGWVSSTCNIAFDRPVADEAMRTLSEVGIDSRQWWSKGCHREPAFFDHPRGDLSVTEDLGRRVLGLPFHEALGENEVGRIVAAVASAAQR